MGGSELVQTPPLHGGGLRYSFDIKSDKVVYEVGVDAKTGKVLENKKEGRHPD